LQRSAFIRSDHLRVIGAGRERQQVGDRDPVEVDRTDETADRDVAAVVPDEREERFALIALIASSPEAANAYGSTILFPVTFVSSASVPVQSMPCRVGVPPGLAQGGIRHRWQQLVFSAGSVSGVALLTSCIAIGHQASAPSRCGLRQIRLRFWGEAVRW
jgi:hypothetical protein